MASYRTILVGTDGSDSSFRAVEQAARLAADTGATLVLASAYHPMSERKRLSAADQLGDLAYKVQGATPAEDALRAARERAIAAGAKDIQEIAVEGDAVDVLVKVAKDRRADLMVVGNRGLNSLAGRILGSVPANLSHRSPCDILIVHTTDGK
ncbi:MULTISPECIES: universal stress protein [Thermomonospora]|uniref:UspA domain protein n=1 Tax=Thermomonospora curvata (strain ATCC 19995 / DSM 43183 / JCM 3096 / KCTC 9072 / NBRC 15933 / NCIMB 10081 / Henssen B9) TaxID=471852 RepID=D1A2Q9_THECD|nr:MULTISPECIES: universal stress protein [Thermomonospora]ACY97857.1 UspA domain protein [Thermomonospora curvata DSM 43183]PKK14142.1 MAG: universal stress protein [Thermomonospora sp. CIF 1]